MVTLGANLTGSAKRNVWEIVCQGIFYKGPWQEEDLSPERTAPSARYPDVKEPKRETTLLCVLCLWPERAAAPPLLQLFFIGIRMWLPCRLKAKAP